MHDLEQRMIGFIADRIAAMGDTESGAYDYYAQRVQRRDLLTMDGRALLWRILSDPPIRLVHAGTGLGCLTACVASAGVPSLGYECDHRRYRGAVALRDTLGLSYEMRAAHYPDAHVGKGGLLLFTNVGADWSESQENGVIGTFSRFDRVILDLRQFGHLRDDPVAQDELLERIPAETTARLAIPGCAYVEIEPKRTADESAAEHRPEQPVRQSMPLAAPNATFVAEFIRRRPRLTEEDSWES